MANGFQHFGKFEDDEPVGTDFCFFLNCFSFFLVVDKDGCHHPLLKDAIENMVCTSIVTGATLDFGQCLWTCETCGLEGDIVQFVKRRAIQRRVTNGWKSGSTITSATVQTTIYLVVHKELLRSRGGRDRRPSGDVNSGIVVIHNKIVMYLCNF